MGPREAGTMYWGGGQTLYFSFSRTITLRVYNPRGKILFLFQVTEWSFAQFSVQKGKE